jgi:putative NADH-flavin reductase
MNIVMFGATGMEGSRIATEAATDRWRRGLGAGGPGHRTDGRAGLPHRPPRRGQGTRRTADPVAHLRRARLDVRLSPAADRTGRAHRQLPTGGDQLLADDSGSPRISAEDYGIAFVDEIERHAYPRSRISVAS